jgi:hypothetical protein
MPLCGCPLRQRMDKTPDADVLPYHQGRKLYGADAGQRRLAQHRDSVTRRGGAGSTHFGRPDDRATIDDCGVYVGVANLTLTPHPHAVRRAGIEAGKPAQIARR